MLIACGACTGGSSSLSIAAAGFFGGWAALTFVFDAFRFKRRMKRLWGMPRFQISDFVSLTLLLVWPLLLASMNRDPTSPLVSGCTAVFILCVGYLWVRSLWILQECHVEAFGPRTMFIAVVLPLSILFSLLIGHWVLTTLFLLSSGEIPWVFAAALGYGVVASLLGGLARSGMVYVFGPPPLPQSNFQPQQTPDEPELWIHQTNTAAT